MKSEQFKLPRILLKQAVGGRWYFIKKNRNGRLTEMSQTYAHKRTAKAAAKRDIPGLPIEEVAKPDEPRRY